MRPEAGARVTVRVPATSANLGPGFDSLGLALELRDEVVVVVGPAEVVVTGEGAGAVPLDTGHLVVRAAHRAFEALDVDPPSLSLGCTNRIPHGRGLGSSAAAVVAGLLAGRALVPGGVDRLDDDAVLALATGMEGHPDNAAACLLGGLTVAWVDERVHAVRLEPKATLRATVLVPATELSTHTARDLLPVSVPHADAAFTAGRAALLVAALTDASLSEAGVAPGLLLAATEDRLHQHYRGHAMPATAALVAALRTHGHAAVVSGAGPTVLVLDDDPDASAGLDVPPEWRVLRVGFAGVGATVETTGRGA